MTPEDFDEEAFEAFQNELPRVAIPDKFKSDLTGEHFSNCCVCDRDLLADDVPYIIEKSFKKYDNFKFENTVFEYAICMPCSTQLQEQMSEESLTNIQAFFQERANVWSHQLAIFENDDDFDNPKWENGIQTCIITGREIDDCEEYQIIAMCNGGDMLVSNLPMMLSDVAMEEMSELLSDKTIDEMDDFMGKIGVPPELRELLNGSPVFVL